MPSILVNDNGTVSKVPTYFATGGIYFVGGAGPDTVINRTNYTLIAYGQGGSDHLVGGGIPVRVMHA